MRCRPAILIIIGLALALVLSLRGRFPLQPGPQPSAENPAASARDANALRQPQCARLESASDEETDATTVRGQPVIRVSRFDAAFAVLPVTEETDAWWPIVERLADSLPVSELGGALVELNGAKAGSPGAVLRERLLQRWTGLAPDVASQWAAALTDPADRREALLQVAGTWAVSDLSAAVAWARTLSPESERDGLLLQLAYETAGDDPSLALGLAAELPPGNARDGLIAQAVGNWATRNPQGAAEWARSLPLEAGQTRALESVAVSWAGADAIAAAHFALDNLPFGHALDRTVAAVVQRWAQSDPLGAATWIEKFDSGALQNDAADNLMANWFAYDRQGPAAWIESLPNGTLRDNATVSYVRQLAAVDANLANAWLGQISDTNLRSRAQETLAAFNSASNSDFHRN